LIELSGVSKVYKMGNVDVAALNKIDLTIDSNEYMSIFGPSGSGKSTLMHILGCLDTPTDGTYDLDGRIVSGLNQGKLAEIRNRKIGFVFQTFNLLPYGTAQENVELPMIYMGIKPAKRKKRSAELLDRVGLGGRITHHPTELSGGEQQRVAIARALANEPQIVLADEPTGNLDTKSGKEVIDLFDELHKQGTTVIMVTHDTFIAEHTKRVVRLLDGEIESDNGSG
jgi:putative ABC transport system ATP-binding protein